MKVEERAKEYQENKHSLWNGKGMGKELQNSYIQGATDMQQEAIKAHRKCCPNMGDGEELSDQNLCYASDREQKGCNCDCTYMKNFIKLLSE